MIKRLLVANRGEIALRIIQACRELGVESVAVYSDHDAQARHISLADRAVRIGSTAASYLSIDDILVAARTVDADAVHPGYGFLAERAAFAAACERAGLIFVGPPSSVIAVMGSKIGARHAMRAAGVPIVPGETPVDQTDAAVRAAVHSVGFPALVKASAGGGGIGMRVVRGPHDVDEAVRAARREAEAAFGDGALYVERVIAQPHHVEVQVCADSSGQCVHLFERECSVQRRHQKIIEESPSPTIDEGLRRQICASAVAAASTIGYCNVGTVEFLLDCGPLDRDRPMFYFLEMNTRLQVEHPVTEQVVGVDLVRAQLLVASGMRLPWTQGQLTQRGHSIEARVYAEDPAQHFVPQAGRLLLYREPRGPGVRIESGVAEGDEISVHFDPLLAKVIATAETRDLAILRLSAALRRFPVLGIRTNIPFLIRLIEHPRFRKASIDAGSLDGADSDLAGLASDQETMPEAVRAAFAAHAAAGQLALAPPRARQWDPWNGLPRWQG